MGQTLIQVIEIMPESQLGGTREQREKVIAFGDFFSAAHFVRDLFADISILPSIAKDY